MKVQNVGLKIASICVLFLSFFGCGDGGGGGNTVTIGVLNTRTGALASTGTSIDMAIELAEKDINNTLKEDKANFRLRFEVVDTQTDPNQALEQLKAFAAKGIKIVIGPLSSSEAIALSDFSLQNGIVLISPSSTAVTLEKSDDLILRLPQNDRGHAKAITAALRHFGTKFYVPIWRADSFGDDLVKTVGARFEGAGGGFAPGSRYAIDLVDFASPLGQLETQLDAYVDFFGRGSSAIYAVAFDEIWKLLEQASTRGYLLRSVKWYGSDGIALNYGLFQSATAVQFMIDTKMISPIFAGDPFDQDFIDIRTEIETKLGEIIRPYAVLTYDAALLAAKALESLGDSEASGTILRDEMIKISSQTKGASGMLSLDQNGDRISGIFEFWKVELDGTGAPFWKRAGTYQSELEATNGGKFIPE